MIVNAKDRIIRRLAEVPPGTGLACHEFGLDGVSENSISARLRELRAERKVLARVRQGKTFKEWLLAASACAAPVGAHGAQF
jgi:predicted transcriptional regulator